MRWATLILAALLVVVQGDLWLGKGNWLYVAGLQQGTGRAAGANREAVHATRGSRPRSAT
jgi:cell division protein FtsB